MYFSLIILLYTCVNNAPWYSCCCRCCGTTTQATRCAWLQQWNLLCIVQNKFFLHPFSIVVCNMYNTQKYLSNRKWKRIHFTDIFFFGRNKNVFRNFVCWLVDGYTLYSVRMTIFLRTHHTLDIGLTIDYMMQKHYHAILFAVHHTYSNTATNEIINAVHCIRLRRAPYSYVSWLSTYDCVNGRVSLNVCLCRCVWYYCGCCYFSCF